MLKQRIATALVFAVAVVALVWLAHPWLLAAAFGVLVLLGAWEWCGLLGLGTLHEKALYVAEHGVMLGFIAWYVIPLPLVDTELLRPILQVALGWWVLAALAVAAYPLGARWWANRVGLHYMGLLVLLPAWLSIVYIRTLEHGEWLVVYAIAVIACADIGAYFAGRAFGERKLMPRVSPGKTVAGFVGGMAASLAFALLAGWAGGLAGGALLRWVLLGLAAAFASVVGDLLESMVKRQSGHKDSGTLLPGHGGLLDRLDSLSAGLPVLAFGMLWTGGFF